MTLMDFEIMPFPLLPPHIRWATGKYNNEEYGDTLFETVDDVDWDGDFDLMYGIIWSDGNFGVYEDYEEALWELIFFEEDEEWMTMNFRLNLFMPLRRT